MHARIVLGGAAAIVLAACICGTAAAQETRIDEIGMVTAGETVEISGTTNLAPGNRLLITVTPIEFGAQGGVSGTAVVEEGNATANTWSFPVETAGFEPGEYLVIVEWVEGDVTASTTFTVVEAAATPTPTPEATPTPAPTPEATPTPTPAGPALPLAAALAAGLIGYLVGRR